MSLFIKRFCLFSLFIISYSFSYSGNFYIKGHINNIARDSDWVPVVYLSDMNNLDRFFACSPAWVIDSAVIDKNGDFEFNKAPLIDSNTFYRLEVVRKTDNGKGSFYEQGGLNENTVILFLQPDSKIKLTTELSRFNYAMKLNKADDVNESLREVYSWQKKTNEKIDPLKKQLAALQNDNSIPADSIKQLRGTIMDLYNSNARDIKTKVDGIQNPYVALYATFLADWDSAFALKMQNRFQLQLPRSRYTPQFKAAVNNIYYTLPKGSVAPEISLPDASGNTVKLSDFKGKYVLIDFWASWCQPCRVENKETVKPLYNAYSKDGVTVISISMDNDRGQWAKAISADKLEWTQLTDFKAFDSPVAKTYRVLGIPTTYVVSPEGKILAKDLRSKQLEDFIKGLLKK